MSDVEIFKCDKCKVDPRVYEVTGLWYVACPVCGRLEVNPARKRVIEHWNEINRRWSHYVSGKNAAKMERAREDRIMREKRIKPGRGYPIYRLSRDGLREEEFSSTVDLAQKIGVPKNIIIGKFYRSPTGIVELKGELYERDTTKTPSATNGGRNKSKTED